MKRSHALALVCALSLLGGTMSIARAASHSSSNPSRPAGVLPLVRDYFAVFNAGMRNGDFSSLASIYAPNATLVMYRALPRDLVKEQTGEAHGLAAITRTYRQVYRAFTGYRWILAQMYRISGSRVVAYQLAQGPAGSRTLPSETVATIRGGKIERLEWTVDFGVRK